MVIIIKDSVRQALHLDDVESIDCLPNEELFAELARMGTAWNEFSSSMASAVICLATGRKFNFSKYIFDSLVKNVDSYSKFYMYPQFLQLMISAQVSDVSSHTTKYTSPALTQKVFANMRRVELVRDFFRVETPLFATMLVQPQPPAAEEEDEVEVPNAPTTPSPTTAPSPPLQDSITTPSQAQPAPPSSPPQEQQTETSESSMTLLNTLMEKCATLSQKVAQLEQDKISQALEILKLKKRVKKLEKKRGLKSSDLERMHPNKGRRIEVIDADKDITLVDAKTQVDAELQGRKDDDNAATKDVNAAEPTVFDDE
nr:hypothetical protein [Tanacetum cinerariifolium]